ncbi:coiled-coil domain-containing protein (plasmid) [Clostridium perfringens]
MTDTDNNVQKDPRININMRIKTSLKNRISEQMSTDNKTPDDFFSEMFYLYLQNLSQESGYPDYSGDMQELELATKRILTIFQCFIEKSSLANTNINKTHANDIESIKSSLTEKYESKLEELTKELNQTKKEASLIEEQAKLLISDSKKLKSSLKNLTEKNTKNEELIETYKEQILSLKDSNLSLQNKLENTVDKSSIERLNLEHEKHLLEQEKSHQEKLNELQQKLNNLQNNYHQLQLDLISKKETPKK